MKAVIYQGWSHNRKSLKRVLFYWLKTFQLLTKRLLSISPFWTPFDNLFYILIHNNLSKAMIRNAYFLSSIMRKLLQQNVQNTIFTRVGLEKMLLLIWIKLKRYWHSNRGRNPVICEDRLKISCMAQHVKLIFCYWKYRLLPKSVWTWR